MNGDNVFYTGSAGCGKSFVLKKFVRRLRKLGKGVEIVAPTGTAAFNIGGCTLHSYLAWTADMNKLPIARLRSLSRRKKVGHRLKEIDVLVLDEISMVSSLDLERLNASLKASRRSKLPFGGVQLIATGDFYQLPPVTPFENCLYCGQGLRVDKNKTNFRCLDCHVVFRETKR